MVMQPQDVLPSGRQDLCDGCPNKTVHNGRLVSMCRVEELMSFGDMVTLRPRRPALPSYLKMVDPPPKHASVLE